MKFYGQVFGWQFKQDDPSGNHWSVTTVEGSQSGGINGGLARKQEGSSRVAINIAVSNIDDSIAKIKAAGGTILGPKQNIPGQGILAICKDPDGIVFGVVQRSPPSPFTEPFK
jgi:predicted enzyme related to lactoylglutathione lyase